VSLPDDDRQRWDAERELVKDRRVERALLWKEAAVVAVLIALVALRIMFAA